jgi:hypothetical protein
VTFNGQFTNLNFLKLSGMQQASNELSSLGNQASCLPLIYAVLLSGILLKVYLVPTQFIIFVLYRKLHTPALVLYLSLYYAPFILLALFTLIFLLSSLSSLLLYPIVGLFGFIFTCLLVLQRLTNDFRDVLALSTLVNLTLITVSLVNL